MVGVVALESGVHSATLKSRYCAFGGWKSDAKGLVAASLDEKNLVPPLASISALESIRLVQVCEQISLQMPASRLLDRAPLRRDGLLLRLPFAPRPSFDGAGQMSNLRPPGADLSLVGLGVGVHSLS